MECERMSDWANKRETFFLFSYTKNVYTKLWIDMRSIVRTRYISLVNFFLSLVKLCKQQMGNNNNINNRACTNGRKYSRKMKRPRESGGWRDAKHIENSHKLKYKLRANQQKCEHCASSVYIVEHTITCADAQACRGLAGNALWK